MAERTCGGGECNAGLLSSKVWGTYLNTHPWRQGGSCVPENRGACVCHSAGSKKNLGTGGKRRAYVRPDRENEKGRWSKDLNIICDTTISQDTAGDKAG